MRLFFLAFMNRMFCFGLFWAFSLSLHAQTVTDIDGNVYNTVTIDTKIWMVENLRTKHFSNGDTIGTTYPSTASISSTTSVLYQWPYDGDENNVATCGLLYTWYVASDSRNVCPANWRVATEADWRDLGIYLGGDSIAGNPLKEAGIVHWTSPNTGTNTTGFTALPGGSRYYYGTFTNINNYGMWWTSSVYSGTNALYRYMVNNSKVLTRASSNMSNGFAIRCVTDVTTGINDQEKEGNVKIYPNPASNVVNLNGLSHTYSKVSIYSMTGEMVLEKDIEDTIESIDISSLPKGVYILKLSDENNNVQKKLVKN